MDGDLEKAEGTAKLEDNAETDKLDPLKIFRRGLLPRRGSLDVKALTQITGLTGQRAARSPTTTSVSEHSEDSILITKCSCPDSETLRLLPFIRPSELGLSRPCRGSYLRFKTDKRILYNRRIEGNPNDSPYSYRRRLCLSRPCCRR